MPQGNLGGCCEEVGSVGLSGVLEDLKVPPGNQLEALSGNLRGQHSIRINDQYRICFRWTESGPDSVEIVDYH